MCDIIKIGNDTTAFICGGKKDHECNEDAVVYETREGNRFLFTDSVKAENWFHEHHKETIMGSVACSICGGAAYDERWKLEI